MTDKNYVKKFKGFDVPEGATHFNEANMLYPSAFYNVKTGEIFRLAVREWELSEHALPVTAIELPEVQEPQINWDEQPSENTVWIVNNMKMGEQGWYFLNSKQGIYYSVSDDALRNWWDDEEGEKFTVYRREDCAVESLAEVEWNGEGLPPAGCVCEFNSSNSNLREEWGACFIVGLARKGEVAFQREGFETVFINIALDKFRPLKTQQEKEREAFVDAALKATNSDKEDWCAIGIFKDMFKAGFTAPKGEGDE